uniref:Uncharacterized protein n=1 Tax=Anguilla anguilla TaxID=7936 RepID=A0A0E9T8E4_ANGAN
MHKVRFKGRSPRSYVLCHVHFSIIVN